MSIIKVTAMSAPEVAAFLRQQLGPLVAWDDWLTDRRRDRGELLADFDLQPCGTVRHRCRRPMYAVRDVAEFVLAVRRRYPAARPGIKPQVCTIDIDIEDPRSWKMRPPAPLTIAGPRSVIA